MTGAKLIQILMVEDNPDDVNLAREALKDAKMHTVMSVVEDGEEAMEYLRAEGEFAERVLQDIILLDLNLPRKDGREVLEEIKDDPALRSIPVVVLTTSDAPEDIARAYNHYVNCYITKPVDFEQFIKVVKSIEDFWFGVVKLPGEAL